MTKTNEIPYKIYLTEEEMPKQYYNVRADMKTKPAPLLNPATCKPMTAEELEPVFCKELVKQELDMAAGGSRCSRVFPAFLGAPCVPVGATLSAGA